MENEILRDDAGGNVPFDPWPFPWYYPPIWHPTPGSGGTIDPRGPVYTKLQADVARAMVALTFEDAKLTELALDEIVASFTSTVRAAAK
jgi:hypothetical protein